MTEIFNNFQSLLEKQAENTETSLSNDVLCRKFLVDPGTMITINNKLKRNFQEELLVQLSVNQVRKLCLNFSSEIVRNITFELRKDFSQQCAQHCALV